VNGEVEDIENLMSLNLASEGQNPLGANREFVGLNGG
jgi:hypothetical protein